MPFLYISHELSKRSHKNLPYTPSDSIQNRHKFLILKFRTNIKLFKAKKFNILENFAKFSNFSLTVFNFSDF